MEQLLDLTFFLEPANLLYGAFIFVARVVDVSLGTLRTIAIVHGRTTLSFWLGFFESAIWLAVVSTIVQTVTNQPLLGVIYAFGFATGNTVGIKIERRIALGNLILRVISRTNSKNLTDTLRNQGYRVTTFMGEGKSGPVTELYIVCRRRDLKNLLTKIVALDPEAFYVTEQAGSVSNVYRPIMQPVTGWRAILKKK
jgi:uncharacterized protein YebE (UPF0316 family)